MLFSPFNPPIRHWQAQRIWIIGASSGIGAALAQQLLAAGASVVLSARNDTALLEVAAGHPNATVVPMDASDPAAWADARSSLDAAGYQPDLLLFCAADYRPEHSWELQAGQVSQTLATNLASVYYGLETVLPGMMARHGGGIALVASVAGYIGLPGACVYGPGKAAMINLAELLYAELRQHGIAVYLINPGFVATRLTAKNDFNMPALLTAGQAAQRIVSGLERGRFEIHFPYRFTLWIKLLQLLPYRLSLPLLQRLNRN
jgi:short-subunit dehydrogenase